MKVEIIIKNILRLFKTLDSILPYGYLIDEDFKGKYIQIIDTNKKYYYD